MIKAKRCSKCGKVIRQENKSGLCEHCYGNKIIDAKNVHQRFLEGKELKSAIPNINCGKCGFKSCNEFIRAVLDKKAPREQCPFINQKSFK